MGRTIGRLALVCLLAGSLTGTAPAAAAQPAAAAVAHPGRPDVPAPVWVPVHAVVGSALPAPTTRAVPPPAPVWPGAGAAVADRTATSASWDRSGAARAGKLPVWVGPSSPAQVGVKVADQAAAAAAGVKGVLLQVWRADGAGAAGSASVSVDYSGFRTAYSADWATRLRMVQLPACALTTPPRCTKPACMRFGVC
jgi:hypothetical protein